jgi:hypothetical protein
MSGGFDKVNTVFRMEYALLPSLSLRSPSLPSLSSLCSYLFHSIGNATILKYDGYFNEVRVLQLDGVLITSPLPLSPFVFIL